MVMKILCLNERMDNDASFRARVLPYLPLFAQNNIQIDMPNVDPSLPISIPDGYYDYVWIRRLLFIDSAALKKLKNVPIIYELDDAIYLPENSINYSNFKAMIKLATLVIAGSDVLAVEATKCGAQNVKVVRTGAEVSKYETSTQPEPIKIVWTGSKDTLKYLYPIEAQLQKLVDEKNIKIKVISDESPKWKLKSENVSWSPTTQFDLKDCSIGISPLPDKPYATAKCAFKVIQYMAAGLPVVASAIGANQTMFSTYHCSGTCLSDNDQFYNALLEWINKTQADRLAAGATNRTVAEQSFDTQIIFNQMLDCFK